MTFGSPRRYSSPPAAIGFGSATAKTTVETSSGYFFRLAQNGDVHARSPIGAGGRLRAVEEVVKQDTLFAGYLRALITHSRQGFAAAAQAQAERDAATAERDAATAERDAATAERAKALACFEACNAMRQETESSLVVHRLSAAAKEREAARAQEEVQRLTQQLAAATEALGASLVKGNAVLEAAERDLYLRLGATESERDQARAERDEAMQQLDAAVLAASTRADCRAPDSGPPCGGCITCLVRAERAAARERDEARAEAARLQRDGDRLADEVAALVRLRELDPRSPAGDALLDYREPPSSPRADRLAATERRAEDAERRAEDAERRAEDAEKLFALADAELQALRVGLAPPRGATHG